MPGRIRRSEVKKQVAARVGANVMPGVPRTLRTRLTAAQVNAGATVLAAIPGFGYRIMDIALIAVGGTTAGITGIYVDGVQSASTVHLLSALIAGLTRSHRLYMGEATNGLILADGASYVKCDNNTPITVVKNGGDLTGATHVDVLLTYVAE